MLAEYLAITIINFACGFAAFKIYKKSISKIEKNKIAIQYSQSRVFELISPFIPDDAFLEKLPDTQARNFIKENTSRILFMDGSAYWISDNALFKAEINEVGEFDKDSAIKVDTMTMNDIQLKKIIFIVEQLREGL